MPSIYDRINAQQGKAYTALALNQVVRRRLETIEGDDDELTHVRSCLAVAEDILGDMANELDDIEGKLKELEEAAEAAQS